MCSILFVPILLVAMLLVNIVELNVALDVTQLSILRYPILLLFRDEPHLSSSLRQFDPNLAATLSPTPQEVRLKIPDYGSMGDSRDDEKSRPAARVARMFRELEHEQRNIVRSPANDKKYETLLVSYVEHLDWHFDFFSFDPTVKNTYKYFMSMLGIFITIWRLKHQGIF
jgi:hypothetical protein